VSARVLDVTTQCGAAADRLSLSLRVCDLIGVAGLITWFMFGLEASDDDLADLSLVTFLPVSVR